MCWFINIIFKISKNSKGFKKFYFLLIIGLILMKMKEWYKKKYLLFGFNMIFLIWKMRCGLYKVLEKYGIF